MTFPFDPTVYAGLVALFLGHAWLARSAPDAQRKHSLYFGLGLLTIWIALETPIDTLGDEYLDSVHMLQHVLLGFVAPPLMLLGLSARMAATVVRVPGLRFLFEPVQAQVIAGVVMIVWHIPALYDATLRSEDVHIFEHVMFIGAGIALYWPILQATSSVLGWSMSPVAKLIYMLLATLPQDAISLVLMFSREPFYDFYTHVPRIVDSLTPLVDQTVAGAVLMILGKVTIAIAALAVFFRWFDAERREDDAVHTPA